MKNLLFLVLTAMLLLAGCDNSPLKPAYGVVLPELPEHWEAVLGEAHWQLEWLDENGVWQETVILPEMEAPELDIIQVWANPVLAWPFWPSRDLIPGMMRPAGAIFPWDVSDGRLELSWEAGVEAVFWKELAAAERLSAASEGRIPWYFDWPRFRELLRNGNIPEEVRLNLWIVDWQDVGERTVQSGFDYRRIKSRDFTELIIPDLCGLWVNSSPFAPPVFEDTDNILQIKVSESPDTWVSADSVLMCSASGWVLR